MSTPRSQPQDAPRTVKAADGRTTLHRFAVQGVIYARSKAEAEQRLAADIYLDHARIVPDVTTAELEQEVSAAMEDTCGRDTS